MGLMDNRKRQTSSSSSGSLVFWSSSFSRQPARVLIVEALPPCWSNTCTVLCDALDNFLSLACSLDGPCRIPLLSLYAVSRQQECLLPFVQVRGNLARLHSSVEELRSIPGEGCIKSAAKGGDLLRQAVLDSLQQFKQYIRHTSTGNQARSNVSVEVTVVTSQPGRSVVLQLESGLKEADLVSLRRLLVVQIVGTGDWGQDPHSPEATMTEGKMHEEGFSTDNTCRHTAIPHLGEICCLIVANCSASCKHNLNTSSVPSSSSLSPHL
ncbi:hypothetical protein ATANTOWER_016581 [Ataeniobius toweri]|uniref:Meiosis 1 associated protein n=1 Tax=Ataeniobius toweri TaxID=208326 RepID=A0ABU7BZH0_9TELE|nr:hypothetical protein [Ataeniobius toweri]